MQTYSPQNIVYIIICMCWIFYLPQAQQIEQKNKSKIVSLIGLTSKRSKNQIYSINQFQVQQGNNGTLLISQFLSYKPASKKQTSQTPLTILNVLDERNLISSDQQNQFISYPPNSSIFQPLKLTPQSLSKPSLPENFQINNTYIQTAYSVDSRPQAPVPEQSSSGRKESTNSTESTTQTSSTTSITSSSSISPSLPSTISSLFNTRISSSRQISLNIRAITVFTEELFPLFFKYNRPKVKVRTNYQFDNFAFYHPIPTVFMLGQTFRYEGVITNEKLITQYGQDTIVMFFIDQRTNDYIICRERHIINFQFNISCQMKKPGSFKMHMFIGRIGKPTPLLRKVNGSIDIFKQNFPQPTEPRPRGLRLQYYNNSLYAAWDSKANLTNLTIYQQKIGRLIKRQYLLSNNHQKFEIPFEDFEQFLPKKTYLQISHAMTLDATLGVIYTKFTSTKQKIQFEAVNHAHANRNYLLMNPELPWRIEVGKKFRSSLTIFQNIKSTFYIFFPDLKIIKSTFAVSEDQKNKDTIKAGTEISLQLSFPAPGTYILQINNLDGAAILNRPIYVGQGYPLIPDYTDSTPQYFLRRKFPSLSIHFKKSLENYYKRTTQKSISQQPSLTSPIEQKQNYLLSLINGLRKKYNVPPVQLDETLNLIAQNHSDDMILKQYVAHLNKQGQRCPQRALKFNFTYFVGQNIAQTYYLTDNHLGLQRSAIHLQNIVNRRWGRVGIGINLTENRKSYKDFIRKYGKTQQIDSLYLVTYVYSIRDLKLFPITPQQQGRYRMECEKAILQKNPKIKSYNQKISEIISKWKKTDRSVKLYQYMLKNKQYLNKQSFRQTGLAFSTNFSDDWVERLKVSNFLIGNINGQTEFGFYFERIQANIEVYIIFI